MSVSYSEVVSNPLTKEHIPLWHNYSVLIVPKNTFVMPVFMRGLYSETTVFIDEEIKTTKKDWYIERGVHDIFGVHPDIIVYRGNQTVGKVSSVPNMNIKDFGMCKLADRVKNPLSGQLYIGFMVYLKVLQGYAI